MKYRRKPLVVDAVKVSDILRVHDTDSWQNIEQWVRDATEDASLVIRPNDHSVVIHKYEGMLLGHPEDYLIRDEKGRLDVMGPIEFIDTHDAHADPAPFHDDAQKIWGINFQLPSEGIKWGLREDAAFKTVLYARAAGIEGRQHLLYGLMDAERTAREAVKVMLKEGEV